MTNVYTLFITAYRNTDASAAYVGEHALTGFILAGVHFVGDDEVAGFGRDEASAIADFLRKRSAA